MGIFKDILGIKSPSEAYRFTSPPKFQTPEDIAAGEIPDPRRMPAPESQFVTVNMCQTDDRRPCWVRGKKAMFHCWVNAAHPVPPRNIPAEEIDEKTRYFQFRSTTALVEFEDGTCARVYPNEVQFADGGGFADYAWLPMAEGGQEDGAE